MMSFVEIFVGGIVALAGVIAFAALASYLMETSRRAKGAVVRAASGWMAGVLLVAFTICFVAFVAWSLWEGFTHGYYCELPRCEDQ
jgi:hypothetical protein